VMGHVYYRLLSANPALLHKKLNIRN